MLGSALALAATLDEPIGDAVQPRRAVDQARDRSEHRDGADDARARDHGNHEHADRLAGLAVHELTAPGNDRATYRGDAAAPPAAIRFDQRFAHHSFMTRSRPVAIPR